MVLGADANARHPHWGSKGTNNRGELLFDYINSSDLLVCNQGTTPTFIFPSTNEFTGWEEVLDVTLCSSSLNVPILNWRVSDEDTFSDHRYILFELYKGQI
ncbi:hypothetical protein, partial [Streptomyces sp. IBSBF 2390]|uniref:hypothetical protein n=1 Tax=Streptomyces sp. IBSBF 2390 TaxID=2903533 RepID=UPI003FA75E06